MYLHDTKSILCVRAYGEQGVKDGEEGIDRKMVSGKVLKFSSLACLGLVKARYKNRVRSSDQEKIEEKRLRVSLREFKNSAKLIKLVQSCG